MEVYQLTKMTTIGFGWASCKMADSILYFSDKNEAKKAQNTFAGDKIKTITLDKKSKFLFNIEHCFNSRSFGKTFRSQKIAKEFCQKYEGDSSLEIYKHKIYNSLEEYRKSNYQKKMVYEA